MKVPTEEELLKANEDYVEANWSERDPKGSLEHAYYHGAKDMLEIISKHKKAWRLIPYDAPPDFKAFTIYFDGDINHVINRLTDFVNKKDEK